MPRITSPHDKLFKEFWSNRETAISFFANYLPPDIGPLLRLETLEICKDSFVNPDLQEFYSDLLYALTSRTSGSFCTICPNSAMKTSKAKFCAGPASCF